MSLALCAALWGCDSSAGTGSGLPAADGGERPVTVAASGFRDTSVPLNPDLPGIFLWFEEDDVAVRMDARSGRYELFAPPSWREIEEASSQMDVEPLPYTAAGFVTLEEDCGSRTVHCLHVQDAGARTIGVFETPAWVRLGNGPYLSPDGRYVSLFRTATTDLNDDTNFEVWTSEGSLVDSFPLEKRQAQWMSDGRTLFIGDDRRSFWFSKPYSAAPDNAYTVPDSVVGSITSVSVGPDGRTAAFSATVSEAEASRRGIGQTSFWVMRVNARESIDFRKVGETSANENGTDIPWFVRTFSPDGRWLLLRNGGNARLLPSAPAGAGGGGEYYTAPANPDAPFTAGLLPPNRSGSVVPLFRYNDLDWGGSASANATDNFGVDSLFWIE